MGAMRTEHDRGPRGHRGLRLPSWRTSGWTPGFAVPTARHRCPTTRWCPATWQVPWRPRVADLCCPTRAPLSRHISWSLSISSPATPPPLRCMRVHASDEIDAEVVGWLREVWEHAG